jgi:hypothetical protein
MIYSLQSSKRYNWAQTIPNTMYPKKNLQKNRMTIIKTKLFLVNQIAQQIIVAPINNFMLC